MFAFEPPFTWLPYHHDDADTNVDGANYDHDQNNDDDDDEDDVGGRVCWVCCAN